MVTGNWGGAMGTLPWRNMRGRGECESEGGGEGL